MKITLITPTYNSAKTLEDTIKSVADQNYSDLEYIVVDGQSKDATKEVVEKWQSKVNIKFISEPDKGIYDAMNKGIRLATGDIVGIINSDDFYNSNDILKKVASAFKNNPDVVAVYGDLEYVDKDNISRITRKWKSGTYSEKKLNKGWIIPHPTFFLKNEVYKKMGKIFDLNFPIAADFELLLRLLKIYKIKVHYIPEVFVSMRTGGNSDKDLSRRKDGLKETKRAWLANNLKIPPFYVIRRLLGKISQLIFKK